MKIFVLFFTLVLIPNLAFAGRNEETETIEMEEISEQKLTSKEKRGGGSLSAETSLSLPHEGKAQTSQTSRSGLLPTLKNLCSSFLSPAQTSKSSSPQKDKVKPQKPESKESGTHLDPEFVVVPRKGTTKSKDIRAYQGGNLDKENQADIYYWNIKVTPPSLPMLRLRCLREIHPVFSYVYRKACLFRRSKRTEKAKEPEDLAQFFDWAWSEASSYYKDDREALDALLVQIQSAEKEIDEIERKSKKINNKEDKEKLGDEDQENKEEDLKISRERARKQELLALLGIDKNSYEDELEIKSKEINNAEDKKKLKNEDQQNQEEDLKVKLEQLRRQKDELQKTYRERAREQEPLAILGTGDNKEKNIFFKGLFEKLNKLAEEKDLKATLSVGQLYLWGLGCQQNNTRAYQHIQLASEDLECSSTVNEILGLLSEEKSSETNDPSKVAEQYYKKMAEKDPHGYIHLARLFGSKKKANEAVDFLELAAKEDYPPAIWALAKLDYMDKEDRHFYTLQSYQGFLRNVYDHLRVIHSFHEAACQNNSRAKEVLTNLRNELKSKGSIANLNGYFEEIVTVERGMNPESSPLETKKSWKDIFLEAHSQLTKEFEPIVYIDHDNPPDTFIPNIIDLKKISRSKIENCMRLAAAGFPMGYFLLGRYAMLINPALAEFCFQRAEHPKMISYLAILTYITPGMDHLNEDALKKEVEENLKKEVKKALKEEVEKKSKKRLEETTTQPGITAKSKQQYEELHKKQLGNLIQAKIGRVFKPGDEETWKRMYEGLLHKKYETAFQEKYDKERGKEDNKQRRKKRAHALWDKARSEGDLLAFYCQGIVLYKEWKNLTQLSESPELSKEKLEKSNELLSYVIASQLKIPALTLNNPTPKLPHYFTRTEFRKYLEEIRGNFTMQALEELF